jgi:20S proteasome alpha/beta subunit
MFCVGSGAQFAYAILDTAGGESINNDAAIATAAEVAASLADGATTGSVTQRQQLQFGQDSPSVETIARGHIAYQSSQPSIEGKLSATELELSQPQTQSQQSRAAPTQRAQAVLAHMPLNEAIDTAVKAVRHATYRDGFSGGYINVLIVNASGIHHVRRVDSRSIPI